MRNFLMSLSTGLAILALSFPAASALDGVLPLPDGCRVLIAQTVGLLK